MATPLPDTASPHAIQEIAVGYLNIQGQTTLKQSKIDQIAFILLHHKLDVLHLQETNIYEDTFDYCASIRDNYQVISQNNESGFGTCSLVHNNLTTSNEILHPSGRIIVFDLGPVTLVNVYAPSGNDFAQRQNRENLIGETLPNLFLSCRPMGVIGGDWNSVQVEADATNFHLSRSSPNLKKLESMKGLSDCFRTLHPNVVSYSHTYNFNQGGSGLAQGASRLDRAYQWGGLTATSAEYHGVSFSDHYLHVIKVNLPEALPPNIHLCKPFFKISPGIARSEKFKKRVAELMQDWAPLQSLIPLFTWWDGVKKDLRKAAKDLQNSEKKEKRARLNYLMFAQSHLSRKVSGGDLSVSHKLKEIQLLINQWFEEQAEIVKLHAKLQDIDESEKVRIYHHQKMYSKRSVSSILKLKTPKGIIEGHDACAEFLNKEALNHLGVKPQLDAACQESLLKDVGPVFTEADNAMLEKEVTDMEVLQSLKNCNLLA